MVKKRYVIGSNETDAVTEIILDSHRQYIWNESHANVTVAVLRRVKNKLGFGPYRNSAGHFGRAQRVFLHLTPESLRSCEQKEHKDELDV